MTCPSRLLCHTGTDWQKKSKRRHKKLAGTGGADAAAKRACTLSRLSKVNEIVILHTAYALALMSEKASSSPPLSPPPAFLLLFLLLSRNSSSETGVPPPPQPNDTACSGAVDHDGAGSSSGQEEVVDVNDASGSDQLDIHAKAPEDCKALSLARARALARSLAFCRLHSVSLGGVFLSLTLEKCQMFGTKSCVCLHRVCVC